MEVDMKYSHLIAIVILAAALAAGLFMAAAEKNEQALKKAAVEQDDAKKADEPAEPGKALENGHIEIWINGKKVLDKSYSSDGADGGKAKRDLNETLRKFEGNDPTDKDASKDKETNVSRTDANIKVVTENGGHTLYVNGWKLEVAPDANGALDVSVKVDKDGKSKLYVNGKEQGLPDGEQMSRPIVRRPLKDLPGFDFDFDITPLPRMDIEKYLRGFRGFDFDGDFGGSFPEFEKFRREILERFRDFDRGFGLRPDSEDDNKDESAPAPENDGGGEQKLAPRGWKSKDGFR
jgi:hypothetical protein